MDDCPIADCVTALQRAIFARDMNTLFWWLQQLPFPAEHARHSAECFRFLASYTRELNPLLHAAYHQAISRELRQQTLGLDDDLFLVNSLCDELAIFRDDRCVAVLKEIATADFPALQQALLARALALSARKDSCSQRISVLLFRFLFAGGLFPDDALIATLAGHPAVLRFVLKQLLLAIERAHPREQADALIAGLVAPFRYDAKVIKAVLACARPPPEAVSPIAALLRGGSLPRPSVAAIVSESATVLQTGLATVAGLVALARTCGSFTADTAPRFVKFFRDSAAADLEAVPPAELKALVRDLCACGAGVGFDVATAVLGKAPAVADEVAAFMTEAESMQHFARWCATFPLVFPHLPPARQQDLLRFLDAQTVNEIKFGHVSWPDGTKAVQAMPLPRCKERSVVLLDESLQETPILHSSSLMSRRVLPSVVLLAVSGWREIAALLRLAPPAPRTLELMTLAMDRHPRALVPTFQEVLARFPPEEAMSWIAPLLEGNQQRQCIAVDIAVALAPHCDAMLGFTLRSLAGLVSGRAASEIVRQRVGRALAELPAAPAHSAEMEKIAVMADLRSLPEPNLRITPVRFLETPILSRDAGRRWSDAKPRQSGIWPVDARPGVKWVGSLGKMTTSTSLKQNHKFQPHASQPRLPGLPRLMKPVEHGLRGGVMTV